MDIGVLGLFSRSPPVRAQVTPSNQVLFGITFFKNELIKIDPSTGVGTLVMNIDKTESAYGLAAFAGHLYTFNRNSNTIDQLSLVDGWVLSSMPAGTLI